MGHHTFLQVNGVGAGSFEGLKAPLFCPGHLRRTGQAASYLFGKHFQIGIGSAVRKHIIGQFA
jgi:hypothetical protein